MNVCDLRLSGQIIIKGKNEYFTTECDNYSVP